MTRVSLLLALALSAIGALASGPDSAPTATPPPAARGRHNNPAPPKPAPFFAGPVYVLSASEGFLILDPGDEDGTAPLPPPPPGPVANAPTIILLDGVSNFTAFFEDGRDLLDGSGEGGPGRAVFTALFARDGLPRGGAGGADLRGTAAGAPAPGRLSLTSVRLAQYDPAARQLVLTANAPATASRRTAAPGTLSLPRPGAGLSLRGVAVTFEAAPRGGPAAASDEKPEGAAAARAAAAALKAARAAGWGTSAATGATAPPATVQQHRRPAPRSGRDLPPSSSSGGAGAVAVTSADEGPPVVRLVALVPAGVPSPVAKGTATWAEVMAHEAVRLAWADARCSLTVFSDDVDPATWDAAVTDGPTAVIVAAIPDGGDVGAGARALLDRPSLAAARTVAALGCGPATTQRHWRVRGAAAYPTNPLLSQVAVRLPCTRTAAARTAASISAGLWARAHSDDALAAIALVIDAGGVPMASAEALKGQGLGTLFCMLRHCRAEVLACVTDPSGQCSAALKALGAAPPGDAVAAYRAITSYECDAFSAFSLCVLQKHRCLGRGADVPARPTHPPLATWRGQPLTHETAERICVGWLQTGDKMSWRVAAGQNSAFDIFPNQIQIFFYGAARNSFWYDPVFQVETLDGRTVWRRRHYRVRRAEGGPGTFWFSVLDSGVVSLEYWTIVDAADDLEWALFAYRGAAEASGQAYVGSMLYTRDGRWPRGPAVEAAIEAALERAGVKVWEMFPTTSTPDALETAPLAIDGGDAAADPIFGPSGGGRRARPPPGVKENEATTG